MAKTQQTQDSTWVEITKGIWNTVPKTQKKKHKDGKRFLLLKTPGNLTGQWVPVYWQR